MNTFFNPLLNHSSVIGWRDLAQATRVTEAKWSRTSSWDHIFLKKERASIRRHTICKNWEQQNTDLVVFIFKRQENELSNYMCTWFLSSSWGKLLVLDHSCNSINKTTLPSSFRTNYEDRRRLWNMVIAQIDIRKWSRSIADFFCQKILKGVRI